MFLNCLCKTLFTLNSFQMFLATSELENSLYAFGKTVKRVTEFYFIVNAVSFSESLVEVALDWFQQNLPLCVSLELLL